MYVLVVLVVRSVVICDRTVTTLRVDSVVRVSGQSGNHTIGLIKLKREVVSECTVPFSTTVPPKTDVSMVICITIQYLKSNVLLRSKLLQFGKIIFVNKI